MATRSPYRVLEIGRRQRWATLKPRYRRTRASVSQKTSRAQPTSKAVMSTPKDRKCGTEYQIIVSFQTIPRSSKTFYNNSKSKNHLAGIPKAATSSYQPKRSSKVGRHRSSSEPCKVSGGRWSRAQIGLPTTKTSTCSSNKLKT